MAMPTIPISAGPSAAYGAPSSSNASVYVEGYKKAPDWKMFAVVVAVAGAAWYLIK